MTVTYEGEDGEMREACFHCATTGRIGGESCVTCGGGGWIRWGCKTDTPKQVDKVYLVRDNIPKQ